MNDVSFPALPQRLDPLSCFHKAQQHALFQTLARLSATDPHSPPCVRYVLGQVHDMLRYGERLARAIGLHAVSWIAPHCPQGAARLALRLDEQLRSIAGLDDAHRAIAAMDAGMRGPALASLMQGVRAHAAQALGAIAHAESEARRVLWPVHDDDALAMLERAILAEFDPVELRYAMQWLIPAVHTGERVRLFAILAGQGDGQLANAFFAMSKDLLCRADHDALLQAIGSDGAAGRFGMRGG